MVEVGRLQLYSAHTIRVQCRYYTYTRVVNNSELGVGGNFDFFSFRAEGWLSFPLTYPSAYLLLSPQLSAVSMATGFWPDAAGGGLGLEAGWDWAQLVYRPRFLKAGSGTSCCSLSLPLEDIINESNMTCVSLCKLERIKDEKNWNF